MTKLKEVAEIFLKNRGKYRSSNKDMVKSLIDSLCNEKISNKKNENKTVGDMAIDEIDFDMYISQIVSGYTRHKDNAISVFKEFQTYIMQKYKIVIDVKYPPIPISNTFERLMYIAKEIQSPNENGEIISTEDLAIKLWVSTEKIEDDIRILQGRTEDPIQVCGKKFIIPDLTREHGSGRLRYESSVHPIFLSNNLTQVLLILKGLKQISEKSENYGYVMPLARNIWQQLSKYAQNRIIFVCENLLIDDAKWYKSLNAKEENQYLNERACYKSTGAGCVLDCVKNRKSFNVEYLNDDGSKVFYKDCSIKECRRGMVVVDSLDKKNVKLKFDQIIRSSYTKEGLL